MAGISKESFIFMDVYSKGCTHTFNGFFLFNRIYVKRT